VTGARPTYTQTHARTQADSPSDPPDAQPAKRRRILPGLLECPTTLHGPLQSADVRFDHWYKQWSAEWIEMITGLPPGAGQEEEEEEEEEYTTRGKRKAPAAAAATEGDTSGDDGTEENLSQYELQRLTRIAENYELMVALGIQEEGEKQSTTRGKRKAPTAAAAPEGDTHSTKRGKHKAQDKGKSAAEPAASARDTNGEKGYDTDEEEPTIGVYIPTHPDDDFGRGNCVEGESSGTGGRAQKRPKTFSRIPPPKSQGGGGKRRNARTAFLKKKCPHGRQHSKCIPCGGSSTCQHKRLRRQCLECGGTSFCQHKRRRSRCIECGGASICPHGKLKSDCIPCGGSNICEHKRLRQWCLECGGAPVRLCQHKRRRSRCIECGGGEICEHKRRRSRCSDCKGKSAGE